MRTTLPLLLAFTIVGLFALPAQAHMIGIRSGGASTGLCAGGLLFTWTSLDAESDVFPEDGDAAGDESILNDCDVVITSLDIQLSDSPTGIPLSHLSEVVFIADNSDIFGDFQIFDTDFGSVLRLFSSDGNSISSSTCIGELCTPPTGTHDADFFFFVLAHDNDDVGYFRIVGFNNDPTAVPEPATLLLLGTGLAGGALKRRRRH